MSPGQVMAGGGFETRVATVAALAPGPGSSVAERAVAVLDRIAPSASAQLTVAETWTLAPAPGARSPASQLTAAGPAEQPAGTDVTATPAGTVSTTWTRDAIAGP